MDSMAYRTRFSDFLNRIRVVHKLSVIYALCVLLPILGLTGVLYSALTDNLSKQKTEQTEAALKRMAGYLEGVVRSALTMAAVIDTDQEISDFLDTQFPDAMAFSQAYRQVFLPKVLRIIALSSTIAHLELATDNPTILPGSYLTQLDERTKLAWGLDSSVPFSVGSRIQMTSDNNYMQFEPEAKQITLVRTLTYLRTSKQKRHLLRIDLLKGPLLEIIGNEDLDGKVTLEDPNHVAAFSYAKKLVRPAATRRDDIVLTASVFGDQQLTPWTLVGRFPRDSFQEIYAATGLSVVGLGLGSLALTALLMMLVSRSITFRLNSLAQTFETTSLELPRLALPNPGSDEIGVLIKGYNRMSQRIQELIENELSHQLREKDLELARKQAELLALQSQINPHMLFNTLEVIRMKSLVKHDPEVADIIKVLSALFRRQFRWTSDSSPIADELGGIEDYLKLQHYTFGDRLLFTVAYDPQLENASILRMAIQPFVENACLHGLDRKKGAGHIGVSVHDLDTRIEVEVSDDGVGVSKEHLAHLWESVQLNSLDGRSVGMANVFRRLKFTYGEDLQFVLESQEGKGFRVRFSYPKAVLDD